MAERITGHTQMIGLFAYPIRHSVSPAMHNAAFAELGLDYAYLAFEVDKDGLEDAIKGMRAMQLPGANLSMPNKSAVIPYLDKLSPAAEMIGAVNTITNDNGVLTGHITDGQGFMMSLEDQGIDMTGKKMTIAGCGGAATAIEVQAALDGVREISIFNIRDAFWEIGEETVKKINEQTKCRVTLYDFEDAEVLRREIADSALLVNATGMGMAGLEGKTWLPDASYLRPELVVADTIYQPRETELLRIAREAGCQTMNGLGMLLFQGAVGFELWTGQKMPVEHVKKVVFEA